MASDQDRFYETIWPLAGVVLRTASVLCHRMADAEDLAQETLLKAFRAIGSYRDGTDARAWLMTILRRTHIDRVRQEKSRPAQSLEAMEIDVAEPDAGLAPLDPSAWKDPAALLGQLSDADLIAAIQKLPGGLQWALLLVDVEGLDLVEAAAVMEVPLGTVKSRVHRARAVLRTAIDAARTREPELGTGRITP